MANTIGRFDFELTAMQQPRPADALPFCPFVRFCLAHSSPATRDGFSSISPNLMTEAEVDEFIAALKKDIDAVGSRAKTALKNVQR